MVKAAFLGLGIMGFPMARHLKAKGHEVTVYNRTAAKAEKWVADNGGRSAPTPRAAAEGQDIVFCCVGNDDDLRQVTLGDDGAFRAMGKAASSSTTPPRRPTWRASCSLRRRPPASISSTRRSRAGRAGAETGRLTVMAGGEQAAFDRAAPVIESYAKACRLLGPSGAGQLAKMMNQICIAGIVQGLAEAIHFGKSAGMDVEAVIEVISKGAAQSWQMENRHKTMLAEPTISASPSTGCARTSYRARRGTQQPRPPAAHRAGRPVLCRSAGHGRPALGHVQPAGEAGGQGTLEHTAPSAPQCHSRAGGNPGVTSTHVLLASGFPPARE